MQAPNPGFDNLSEGGKVTALWKDALASRRDIDKAIGEELDFNIKLRHYADDAGEQRDRRRIQPKGRELRSKTRHKVAEICKDLHFTAKPADDEDQTEKHVADTFAAVLKRDVLDPQKDYLQVREDMVELALSGRLGVIALDWVPGVGPFNGEILPRVLDARKFHWTHGWKNIHDYTCPWVIDESEMRVEDIRRMKSAGWKNTDEVMGDGQFGVSTNDSTVAPGNVRLPDGGAANPSTKRGEVEPYATILKCWYRFDDTTSYKPSGDPRTLRPDQRYAVCADESGDPLCGYQDNSQPGEDLKPDNGPCPQCGQGTMQRVDKEQPTEQTMDFPNGRLVIVAPGSQDTVLYDGPWPCKVRSFPYAVYHCYPHPLEQVGMSDTAYDWSLQLIADALMRIAYEQSSENRDLIIAPVDGLMDAENEPWQFSDTQGRIAYWTGQGTPQVQHFQGSGVPPGWRELFGQVQSVLMRDMGTSDIAMGSDQTRNIPVGTVRALQETGEVPVDHHKRKLWRTETMLFSIWSDMINDCWTMPRKLRVTKKNGQDVWMTVKGGDMPRMDILVSASPAITNVDEQEVNALVTVLQQPPPMQVLLARKYNIDQNDLMEFQQGMAQQPPPPPDPKVWAAALDAMARMEAANPGFISLDEVNQVMAKMGLNVQPTPDPHQMLRMQLSAAKGASDAFAPPPGLQGLGGGAPPQGAPPA